jgi:hypothetical protein
MPLSIMNGITHNDIQHNNKNQKVQTNHMQLMTLNIAPKKLTLA